MTWIMRMLGAGFVGGCLAHSELQAVLISVGLFLLFTAGEFDS